VINIRKLCPHNFKPVDIKEAKNVAFENSFLYYLYTDKDNDKTINIPYCKTDIIEAY